MVSVKALKAKVNTGAEQNDEARRGSVLDPASWSLGLPGSWSPLSAEERATLEERAQGAPTTPKKRKPHKPVTYELACVRWHEYAEQYVPRFGKSQTPPLRDFPSWWKHHHPADAVSRSTLGKLRKSWNPATQPFPPARDSG